MKNNTPYNLDFSVVRFFLAARRVYQSFGLDCISDIVCLITAMMDMESEEYLKLINKGIDFQTIDEVADTILSEHTDTILKQKKDTTTIEFPDIPESFTISNEAYKILDEANTIAKEIYGVDVVSYMQLVDATRDHMPHTFDRFVKLCDNLDHDKYLEKLHRINVELHVPEEIFDSITVLNNDYSPNEKYCRILGREKELKKLTTILAKTTKRNAILVGEPGVGKTAIMDKLAWQITTGNAPKIFKDSIMILLDINSLIAGTEFRGTAEKKFQILKQFLENNPNVILCIDEIHTMLGAGACRPGEMDLANSLKPILARGNTQIIGATTQEEYEKYFSSDGALKRRFEKIVVEEPTISEVYPMIENQIRYLSENHGVKISKELIDKIIFYASAFNSETCNPDRTLDLIDKTMALVKLDERKEATLEDVLCNFDSSIEKYKAMPLKQKTTIAYHEAGHFVVNYFSPELIDRKTILVSIIPGESTGGINVYDYNHNTLILGERDYFVQRIASLNGGRIAEEIYSFKLTAGANSDLVKATKYAETVVLEYGLIEEFTRTRVFPGGKDNPLFTDEIANRANDAVNNLLKEAEDYAKKLLEEKKEYLKALVDALLEKRIMSGEEIVDLFKQIDKKNKVLT